jgi:hypothetical protein
MALLALNATFLPIMTKAQVANASLVMWTMAATGVVTGILTLGGAVNTLLMRLFVGSLAYAFIWMQSSRIARARAAQSAGGQAAGEPSPPASSARSQPRTRQRRGGRKR